MVGNLVDKIAVVRHHNHAPTERAKVLLQHAEGHNIEVVGRLVEHQKVGVAH